MLIKLEAIYLVNILNPLLPTKIPAIISATTTGSAFNLKRCNKRGTKTRLQRQP